MAPPLILCLALSPLLLLLPRQATAASSSNTLHADQNISSTDTLVSSDGTFALGFYNSSPTSIYLAIWYNGLSSGAPIWIANRDHPIRSLPANLTLSSSLVLTDARSAVIWSSANSPSSGATVVLENTGNLVLRGGDDTILWDTATRPTDTILTGTKLWSNRATGNASSIRSWTDGLDPSSGNVTFGIDPRTSAQFVMRRGEVVYWRSHVWGGAPYTGISMGTYILYIKVSSDESWSNISFSFSDSTAVLNARLSYTGRMELMALDRNTRRWSVAYYLPAWSCEAYASCGPFGVCDGSLDPPACSCLDGFEPKNRSEWNSGRYGGGCVRQLGLSCGDGDLFVKVANMKLPDHFIWRSDLDRDGCNGTCHGNCSCVAYTYSDLNSSIDQASGSRGCLVWFQELIDMAHENGTGIGTELYVRVGSASGGSVSRGSTSGGTSGRAKVISVLASVLGSSVLILLAYLTWRRRKYLREKFMGEERNKDGEDLSGIEGFNIPIDQGNLDLPLLDFEVLVAATDNFSDSLKIGQGGFGKVYKGILPGGEEVAIKRLSKGSGQGLEEFKNEVILIAQLQHRNLVRLLGCCAKGGERLLIYEYMHNKSLDFLLFGDVEKENFLGWERRFSIIKGIARGLLYLHEESRLTIIHRDLKTSNVLLDGDMNPRISDFGMARIFGGNQNQANTVRIAGTYGYMSPEYAMKGIFSVKSDVYSFGVLLLEIITGQRNTGFRHNDKYFSLLSYAWESWSDGNKLSDIVDPSMGDSFSILEVARCVHIGLLCVQDRPKRRPTMSLAVFMLENSSPIDAMPEKPTFTPKAKHVERSTQERTPETGSLNRLTLTAVQCR